MWWTADEDVNYLIDYMIDGEYVIPTAATATVRDTDGNPIVGLVDVVLDVTTTSANVAVPSVEVSIGAGLLFEHRYISLTFVSGGRTYQRTFSFKIAPFLPITASPGDVRRELGIETSEAPDKDIDVISAYFWLLTEYGTDISGALTLNSEKTMAVNQAIAVRAALELANGLPFRVATKMKAEDSAFERAGEVDVDVIRTRLGRRLSDLLDVIQDTTATVVETLVLSSPTDAITGA